MPNLGHPTSFGFTSPLTQIDDITYIKNICQTATKRQLGANRMISNDLKPMRIAATIAHKPAARSRTTPQDQPQR